MLVSFLISALISFATSSLRFLQYFVQKSDGSVPRSIFTLWMKPSLWASGDSFPCEAVFGIAVNDNFPVGAGQAHLFSECHDLFRRDDWVFVAVEDKDFALDRSGFGC